MNPSLRASLILLCALLLAPSMGMARSSDRNQPMSLDAGHQVGTLEGTGTIKMSGGVIVQQGSLDIRSQTGEVIMKNDEITRVIFTGAPVTLKQQMEDGSPMSATANRIEYDLINDVVTFIGNYTVKSPRGSNSGQKLVYNLRTGNMESGGDGSRVKTVIQPRSAAAKPGATK
jgi:lipopolysaccharide export system protein LptA